MQISISIIVAIVLAVIVFSMIALFASTNTGASTGTSSGWTKFYDYCSPGRVNCNSLEKNAFFTNNGLTTPNNDFEKMCKEIGKSVDSCIIDCCRMVGK